MQNREIIINIRGGFGNQIFQYAFGRTLALRLACLLKLDLSWYTETYQNVTKKEFVLDIFSLEYSETHKQDKKSDIKSQYSPTLR